MLCEFQVEKPMMFGLQMVMVGSGGEEGCKSCLQIFAVEKKEQISVGQVSCN